MLACFGGAGGQHACAIARSLGMSTVFIHRLVPVRGHRSIQIKVVSIDNFIFLELAF